MSLDTLLSQPAEIQITYRVQRSTRGYLCPALLHPLDLHGEVIVDAEVGIVLSSVVRVHIDIVMRVIV